jgi:hypothetical protein
MLAHTLCDERHTITGLLCTAGLQNRDWSGAYRLYSGDLREAALFDPVREGIVEQLPAQAPLVVAVDDSTMHKSGKHIPAAGWHRDPLSPGFQANLIHAHKFIQLSAAVPNPNNSKRARLIPIDVELIPKLPKLSPEASEEQRLQHEKDKQRNSPGAHAARMLRRLREKLDASEPCRRIVVCGDGHYSTASLLQHLPANTSYIGRIRGDTHLCAPAQRPQQGQRGRKPSYGDKLPTPEELRKDKSVPWNTFLLEKDGQTLQVRFKHIAQAKWHAAGEEPLLQVLVIGPLRYRRKKKEPWRYTRPAYLLCTDAELPVEEFIQFYLWRWDIEVNFKDEKQLFGLGQAQVRHHRSVQTAPAVCIAAYAGLLLAALRVFHFKRIPLSLSAPKWYPDKRKPRVSTRDLLRQLRQEAAARSLRLANFSDFSFAQPAEEKPLKFPVPHEQEPLRAVI